MDPTAERPLVAAPPPPPPPLVATTKSRRGMSGRPPPLGLGEEGAGEVEAGDTLAELELADALCSPLPLVLFVLLEGEEMMGILPCLLADLFFLPREGEELAALEMAAATATTLLRLRRGDT